MISDEIKLSVIIPVYNVAEHLPKCIESILETSELSAEFIFVDDGSMDESLSILKEYSSRDVRMTVITKDNGGCASARNAGLDVARGQYVGFVDGDDYIDGKLFDSLLEAVYGIEGGYDYAYSGYSEYYQDSDSVRKVLNDKLSEPYISGVTDFDLVNRLMVNTRVAIWRAIYKRSILERHGIKFHEEIKRFDDLPFRVEFLMVAQSSICVPQHLYFYRLNRAGQDVAVNDDRLYVHFDIFRILDRYLDEYIKTCLNERESDIDAAIMIEKQITYDQSDVIKVASVKKLRDYLQIVKVCTHGWALENITKEYRAEYLRLASMDIKRNMSKLRTLLLVMRYTGKGHIKWICRL